MAELSPLRRRMIEDMIPQSAIGEPTIVYQCGFESSVNSLAVRQVGDRRRPEVPGYASCLPFLLGRIQPDRLRFLIFLRVRFCEAEVPYAREPRKLPAVLSAEEPCNFS